MTPFAPTPRSSTPAHPPFPAALPLPAYHPHTPRPPSSTPWASAVVPTPAPSPGQPRHPGQPPVQPVAPAASPPPLQRRPAVHAVPAWRGDKPPHTPVADAAPRSAISRALKLVWVAPVLLATACASPPVATAQLAVATAALAHAEAAGSAQGAATQTTQAREKLRLARVAEADREPVLAMRLAQQAQLDALLAESLTETAKARQAVADTQAASRALKEEMARQRP